MSNKRILVVDDEPHLIRSLSFILTKEGYEVITASDGEEAVQKAIENKPALIFLDIMMPRKNGYEVCQYIKSRTDLKETIIIILSAKGGDIDREKALSIGANDFMTKPFSPLEVVSKVKKTMENLFSLEQHNPSVPEGWMI